MSNTGNNSFTAIRFTAQKHQLNSPANKSVVTANTAPTNQATTAASVDPLPWVAGSLHNFYTDYLQPAPSNPLHLTAGTVVFTIIFSGQITTAGPGTISFGYATVPGGPIVMNVSSEPIAAGNVAFNILTASGPVTALTMFPTFTLDVDVTAVTVAPRVVIQYIQI